MTPAQLHKLNHDYQHSCKSIVDAFCEKQDIPFDDWQGNIGEVACFQDHYVFHLSDVLLDLNKQTPKGLILEYYEETIHYLQYLEGKQINYASYIMGARYDKIPIK